MDTTYASDLSDIHWKRLHASSTTCALLELYPDVHFPGSELRGTALLENLRIQ
jgi:hypothetical protein